MDIKFSYVASNNVIIGTLLNTKTSIVQWFIYWYNNSYCFDEKYILNT